MSLLGSPLTAMAESAALGKLEPKLAQLFEDYHVRSDVRAKIASLGITEVSTFAKIAKDEDDLRLFLEKDVTLHPRKTATHRQATGCVIMAWEASAKKDNVLMFHLGTNNWQRQGEFAPGSGILHASFHQTFNAMPGVKCYSIFPSKVQTNPVSETEKMPTFRVFKLTHDIPICESVSPNSSFRWHSMNNQQFAAYRKRLEDEVCAFMDEIEEYEGRKVDYIISHHAFTNAMTAAQILERRFAQGNTKLRHFNFVHGTALKMFIKEQEQDSDYPSRFLPLTRDHGVFNGLGKTSGIWVNSRDYIDKFCNIFTEYPRSHAIYSQIGVSQKIFCPKAVKVEDLAKHVRPEDAPRLSGVKRVVTFVGKFADWKRLDAVLYAASEYEAKHPDLGTLVVGTGPEEAIRELEGLAKKLGLQRAFFLGAKSQDDLAKLFSMSEVGMFPSYNEPFGMVFVECFACGTPAIGAKSGGPMEFVHPEQGILVEEEAEWRTPEGAKRLGSKVAAAVGTALREEWKKKKGKGCVKFVEENFSTLAQCSSMLGDMRKWSEALCDVGIIGLATMGSNLALNVADKGFRVAVFNRTFATTESFLTTNAASKNLYGFETMAQFAASLKKPRRALILVKAGGPTDATIKQLQEHFEPGDVIVDTGNAHFKDQTRRAEELEAKGLRFLGMGISGGEEGARKGPAFFPGGTLSVWNDIKDVIEAASAKAEDGRPCAVMNGKGGAGSCVKMYHNAGEYAILQIWGEVYAILKHWGIPASRQHQILSEWKTKSGGKHNNLLSSYMLDVTAEVVRMVDNPDSGGSRVDGSLLIDKTLDVVGSKGTGLWSVQEALGAGVPAPSLAEAVMSRQMTMYREERLDNARAFFRGALSTLCSQGGQHVLGVQTYLNDRAAAEKQAAVQQGSEKADDALGGGYRPEDIEDLFWAVGLALISSYAQMFQCLRVLDKEFQFGLDLPAIIATFRSGCILKGYLLTPMTKAFENDPNIPNLLCAFAEEIQQHLPRFRRVMAKVIIQSSSSAPVLMASLNYIESMCSKELAAGQAVALQRDVFGRHGFKRLDKEGDFNATWPQLQ